MAPHEFHQPDPSRHAPRLGVRAIEHARTFLDRGEKSERARDESDVVINGLRHADNRQRVAAIARFLVEIVRAAREAMSGLGYDLDEILAQEEEPGLGNGGLGRLAACYMDSLASVEVPRSGTAFATSSAFSIKSSATAGSMRSATARILPGNSSRRSLKWHFQTK